jgi:hypothetical protein
MQNSPIESDCCQHSESLKAQEDDLRSVFSSMNCSEEEPMHIPSLGNEAHRYCSAGIGWVPDSGATRRLRAFLSERSSTSV